MRHLLRLALPSSGPLGGSCGLSAALPAGERLAAAAVVAFLLLALFA